MRFVKQYQRGPERAATNWIFTSQIKRLERKCLLKEAELESRLLAQNIDITKMEVFNGLWKEQEELTD